MNDDPDSFFAGRRILLVGLGLMGGSLALALGGKEAELFAIDPDPATRRLALERRIVDHIVPDFEAFADPVDVIILAAPVRSIIEHIHFLGDRARRTPQSTGLNRSGSTIVLDLGSTKHEIVEAMKTLPEQFDPIGGHPMCGKEISGLVNAEAAIFHGATFAFTTLERTSSVARAFAGKLAAATGAVPLWTDPNTHDRWVAATSHMPYLLANALAGVTPLESAPLVGPGYRSTTRLAESSLPVMLDILETNRQPVLEALHRFQDRLEALEKSLAEDDFHALSDLLASAAQSHQSLVRSSERKSG
jgi:prephenate dehydrogenase